VQNNYTLDRITNQSNLTAPKASAADAYVSLKLAVGDKIKVTYTNLTQSVYKGKPLSKIEVTYELTSAASSGLALVTLEKDPTDTLTISSPYSKEGDNGKTILKGKPVYYDADGQKISFSKDNPIVYVFSSLNNRSDGGTHSVIEGVEVGNGRLVEYNGSSIKNHNGIAYSEAQNSYNNALVGLSFDGPKDWDGSNDRRATYGAIAAVYETDPEFSVYIQNKQLSSDIPSAMWISVSNKLEESSVVPPEPTPPTPPTPPIPVTTGNEPVEPPKVEEPQYETAEEPKPPVEPVKPVITDPKEPTAPTPPNEVPKPGEPEKVPEPKEPIPFEATFHKTAYAETPKPVKGITNEAGEDVTGQFIPKGSTVKFPITLPSLKAGRDMTKTFVIEDVIDEGIALDLEAVKKDYQGFEVSLDENRLLKLVAKEDYLKEMNQDLTKPFDFVTPDLIGRVLNDGKTYVNTLKVTRNDYTSYSETVDVSTPGRFDKSTTRDSLIEPTKTVLNGKGEDWTGKAVLPGDLISYPNTWDNDQFKAIKDGDKDKHIHLYIEDIDGTKFTPQLDQFQAIDSDQEAVKGLKAVHVESVDKADKELQDYLKGAGLYDKIEGDFVALIPEDMMAFEEAYIKTGKVLTFNLVGTPKEGATGVLKNTSYQVSFGNGYKTSTVENPIQVTTEWEDINTKETLKDKVTGDKTESRGDFTNYRFVETVPTKTGVKHLFERLYTTEWVDEQGKTLKDMVTDTTTKEKGTVPDHTWVDTVETETGIKHIFRPVKKSTAKGLPSTGDQAGSFIAYLGVLLIGLAIAWKTGLLRKIRALISR
uniref:GbpC/Spa domain-containing protein n=1 Tax=Streptococcus sp. S784/96/1 TaxID=2653499 RepID=UPI00138753FC